MPTAALLDGKALAARLLDSLRAQINAVCTPAMPQAAPRAPCLAVVLVGDDVASAIYVRNKHRACAQVGITSCAHTFPASLREAELLALIAALNADPAVDGILVQAPLPDHIDPHRVIGAISPHKDVDGFHPVNVGRLALKMPGLRPCTPHGVMTLLAETGVSLEGKLAVVVGASHIVGRPMALELLGARATVTVCHSRTRDLAEQVRRAEILVSAVGKPAFIPGEWVRPGAIVIDVGMNRLPDGRLCGDIVFPTAARRAAWITPVPGGVGPMTIATLMHNTVAAWNTCRTAASENLA